MRVDESKYSTYRICCNLHQHGHIVSARAAAPESFICTLNTIPVPCQNSVPLDTVGLASLGELLSSNRRAI